MLPRLRALLPTRTHAGHVRGVLRLKDTCRYSSTVRGDEPLVANLRRLLSANVEVDGSKLANKIQPQGVSFKEYTGVSMGFKEWLLSMPSVAKVKENKQGRFSVKLVAEDVVVAGSTISAAVSEPLAATHQPKTMNQELYLDQLQSCMPYVVVTGPAGSGKTALACVAAVDAMIAKEYQRLVITRPAVTGDEDLGYLPGDAQVKLKPFMQPIIDALEQCLSKAEVQQMEKDGRIVIAPLSFMRGRTLKDSFVIADEMQNATWDQLKLVLTRLGEGSKMVITGDLQQSDLRGRAESGLLQLLKRVEAETTELEYLRLIKLENEDVVRHAAVAEILKLLD